MHLDSFVFSAVLLLTVTSIAVVLSKRLGLGSVLGLLVAGVIVGPHSPGPNITTHVEDVRDFTELGIVLLLFLIGLEMKPSNLWAMRREVLGLGSLQIFLSGLALSAYAALFQENWEIALLFGFTLALSSTAFVMQLLHERGEVASPHGRTAFSILLMQDLAVLPLLAIVPILSDTGTLSADVPLWEQLMVIVGMLTMLWVFGHFLLPHILNHLAKQGNREGFLLVVMLAVFLAAWATNLAGVSMVMGAFMMGMMLSNSRYRLQVQAFVEPYKGILMSLFFVAVGMSIDIKAIADQSLVFASHVLAVSSIKVAILFVLALAFGLGRSVAIRICFMLSQGGEFAFVVFASAKGLEVIDDATFVIGIGVVTVTMLLTPLLVRLGDKLAQKTDARQTGLDEMRYQRREGEAPKPIMIGGYGRVGHTIATILHSSSIPFIAFDEDPGRVAQGKKDNHAVYYGDIGDPALLTAAGIEQVALVILTIDSSQAALRTVKHLRASYPDVPIIARARDLETSAQLLEAGATHAYPEAIEGSMRLAAIALEMIDVPQETVDVLLKDLRSDGYFLVRDEEMPERTK